MLLSKDFIKNNTARPLNGEKKKPKTWPHRKQTALKFTSSVPPFPSSCILMNIQVSGYTYTSDMSFSVLGNVSRGDNT